MEAVTLGTDLRRAVEQAPARPAVVGFDSQTQERTSLDYAEYGALVDRLRGGLAALGVGVGDRVAIMLPNCTEFAALIWAVVENGSVYSGIPSAYGEREAMFILRRTRARVMVLPAQYKTRDWLGLAQRLRSAAPDLEHVVMVGDAPDEPGFVSYRDLQAADPPADRAPIEPSALVHIGFTSGTTGEPKGVMNSHATLGAVMRHWVEHVGRELLVDGSVNLIASPVGHHTGFLWGVLLTPYLRGTAVFVDRWEADRALQTIEDEGVTTFFGAPTFLQDLLLAQEASGRRGSPLRIVTIAGAPVPRTLPIVAGQAFGCFVCPAWGMTEYGIGISAAPDQRPERVAATDGVPVAGCQARVVDDRGVSLPADREGDLQIRGEGLFLGYYERPDLTAAEMRDGWFETGDRATVCADGHILLQGRSKDIVIRGGENIPVVEVESMLFEHDDVLDAAVVGIPDERLGERCCAVLVLRPGADLAFAGMVEYLLSSGLSKHFLPELLEVADALPKTMSGKVKKAELRAAIASGEGVPSSEPSQD